MSKKPTPTLVPQPPKGEKLVARATLAAALIAAVAAGYSALLSYEAASAANEIARDELDRKTAQGLLNLAVEADFSDKDRKCEAVTALIEVERGSREQGKVLFVETYFNAMVEAAFYGIQCEDESDVQIGSSESAIPDSVEVQGGRTDGKFKIGQWHALIASYDTTPKGCAFSTQDIEYFSRALAGKGFGDLMIYVARTTISNNYAVTVDAGDNVERAREISLQIREVAKEEEAPTGSGLDSFVQGNRNWNIDPKCAVFRKIGG